MTRSPYRYRTTGSDNWTGFTPRTDADRLRAHGKVLPMEQPASELPRWAGTLVALCCLGVIVAAVLFLGEVM